MYYFDLVAMRDDRVDALAGRLGYRKMFRVGSDVEIVDRVGFGGSREIVRSDNVEVLTKGLRETGVIGALPYNDSISKKAMEMIKREEKVLFIPVSQVVCADSQSRMQRLARTRSLVRNALMSRVEISLISLAEEREGMLSSAQMIEVANFLGVEQNRAKTAMSVLGDLL